MSDKLKSVADRIGLNMIPRNPGSTTLRVDRTAPAFRGLVSEAQCTEFVRQAVIHIAQQQGSKPTSVVCDEITEEIRLIARASKVKTRLSYRIVSQTLHEIMTSHQDRVEGEIVGLELLANVLGK